MNRQAAGLDSAIPSSPRSAPSLPITYAWQADGQAPIIHTGGISDSIAYTWELSGTYQITVTASNIFSVVTDTHTIMVVDALVASFASNSPVTLGEMAVFTNTTTGAEPLTYLWDFGDGITSTLEHPTHVYTETGSHTVTLTATNTFGSNQTTSVFVVEAETMEIYLPLILRLEYE